MPRKELTQKQELFLQEYLKCGIGYQAYIKAFPSSKSWKRNSIDVAATKLLNNAKIQQRIATYNSEIESTLKTSTTLNKRKILEEIIELQQRCRQQDSQNTVNLQALKLLSQIAGLLSEQTKVQVNIQNNTITAQIDDYLGL